MNGPARSRRYAVMEAPSTFGLRTDGVDRLPTALLANGLAERIYARRAGRVEPGMPRDPQRDPVTHTLNAAGISDYAYRLAHALQPLLHAREFPVVLGGDCTILLGPALALRRRGRFGLLFIDGQADFYQPEAEPHGEGASMDLALVTGYGPDALTIFDGNAPLIRPSDAVAFGYRDAEDQAEYRSQPIPESLRTFDLPTIRERGVVTTARDAVDHLSRPELEGFWIHVDADCLDDAVMPAVDFRLPDGLSPEELQTTLTIALDSGRAVGLEVTIYNPSLDADGRAGRLLTDLLVRSLA